MASLQSSCAVLCTSTPQHRKPNPFSPFVSHARRSPTFHVSCNGGGGRIDRRNMLLGLGGLYGAAKGASANPIQSPEFTNCGDAYDAGSGKLLQGVKCCPPIPATSIIDYVLPPVDTLRVRPVAHRVTEAYLAKYEEAIRLMRELDEKDPTDPRGFTQQANVHCAYCNGAHDQVGYPKLEIQVHNSWLFFPFHRWYLYFFERIMGKLIDDPTFTLPFWNWDNPEGMEMPEIFDNENSPLYDSNRDQACRSRTHSIIQLGNSKSLDKRQIVVNNLSTMYHENIRSVHSTLDFMGKAYRAGDEPGKFSGMGSSERGSHIAAHVWVGDQRNDPYHEDMGNFYSAGRDPLFYCHHSNVDRMWSIWRTLKTDVPKDIVDPDYLNASFLFYDENKQLVRVRAGDCTDHKRMGYEYQKVDIPWLHYKPSKKVAKVMISDISQGVEHANKVFPLTLNNVTRVLVNKSGKGRVDEILVLSDIVVKDPTKFVKFDVYINDKDHEPEDVHKAEYAGTFAQLPHKNNNNMSDQNNGSIDLNLKDIYNDIYNDIDTADDETIVVTLIPRSNGGAVEIGRVEIIPMSPKLV